MKTNAGIDLISNDLGNPAGATGSATSPTATGFTTSGLASGAYVGQVVVLGAVYGVITANTATSVTVERWVNPASPGGAAGTTPSAGTFVITPGQGAAAFMALTANGTAPGAGDTALTGEITTAGLVRKLAAFAHTAGTNTYTLGATFTAQAADVPVTVHKAGMFPTLTPSTGTLVWETVLSADAAFNAAGDQATITQTVTIS